MDIVARFFSLPIFLIIAAVFIFAPGFWITKKLALHFSIGEQTLVSFCFGFCLIVACTMIAGMLDYPMGAIPIVSIFSIGGIRAFHRSGELDRYRKTHVNPSVFATNILGVIAMGWFMFRGAIVTPTGVYYAGTSYHDSLWHLSLIAELQKQFPPQVPTIAGFTLKNYHYFSDLVTAFVAWLSPFSLRHVYFFDIPFVMILLSGLSVFVITKRLTQNAVAPQLALILTYFCGSFAYLLPLFYGPHFSWQESSFWVSQTVSMAQNPPFLFSIPIFFAAILLLAQVNHGKALLSGGVLIAFLIGFKVYAFFIGVGALGFIGLWSLLFKRQYFMNYFFTSIITAVTGYIISIPLRGAATSSLFIFQPLWYLRAMVEHQERVPINDWVLRENTYRSEHNSLRIVQLQLQELVIFVVGNLGVRVAGLLGLFSFVRTIKQTMPLAILLLGGLIPAFVLPLLFVQNGVAAATIQFWYYVLLIMDIFGAIFLASIFAKLSGFWRMFLPMLFVGLMLPTTMQNMIVNRKGLIVLGNEQYQALQFLKNNTPTDSIVLTPGDVEQLDKAYVAAFSGRRTYFTYNQIAEITKIPIDDRKKLANEFFSSSSTINRKQFLRNNRIDYIYDPIGDLNFAFFGIKPIYQNNGIVIYKAL